MRRGDTIVTTGTASGKSLCFNLPVLHVLAGDPRARALYLYPTKALAQDQARSLTGAADPRRCATRSTTATRPRRSAPRSGKRANVVLTNPDMLHVGILPHHAGWGDFLANLALVVVDEAHVYRGVFGSHVANVLRRLRRLAEAYGTQPRFVLTSATIANPLVARARADRARVRPRRPRRLRARPARGRDVQPAAARRAHDAPRIQPRRGRRACSPTWSQPRCARSASRAAAARPS